ncbi:MAG TPA: ATP-binding protein [Pyrinomonadaceae bacterium]
MTALRVLHVEDQERDVALITRHLSRADYEIASERVDTPEAMRDALKTRAWDVILCDYSMPHFNALQALKIIKEIDLDIPVIIISGTIGEAAAVEAMRAGANDYLMKDSLARLVPAIEREMSEAGNRRARQQAEEQLRLQSAAVQAAANAILITDRNGKILWVNPAFTKTTGYSFDEVHGRNPRLLKSGKQDRAFYQNMWDTILAGKVWHNTVINRRKDGTLNREDLTITPIRDEAGAITHFIGIKQDITQLAQALSDLQAKNEELAAMTQQLWQASRLATVGELAASIAHELNNPLATVSLKLETLAAQLNDDANKLRAVEIVADEVERMGNLVGNLLQFSRRSHQQASTVNISEEIDKSLELVEYHLRSNKIQVVRDYAKDVPTIQADRQQLRQVFLNLLTNASDAMDGGGTLTVTVAQANDVEIRRMVRVEFIDSGAGIEPANLEKIWDPFFTTKPEGKGTGLGLAICRRVVEEHRGSIAIESEIGRGTKIIIDLPATNGDEDDESTTSDASKRNA